jgi:hypothetical protein
VRSLTLSVTVQFDDSARADQTPRPAGVSSEFNPTGFTMGEIGTAVAAAAAELDSIHREIVASRTGEGLLIDQYLVAHVAHARRLAADRTSGDGEGVAGRIGPDDEG